MTTQHASCDLKTRPTFCLGDERKAAKVQALRFFHEHPEGTISSLAVLLCYSKRNTERIVAELKDEGLLTRQGNRRSGQWIVELKR